MPKERQLQILELAFFEEHLNTRTDVNDIDLDMVKIYKSAIGANEVPEYPKFAWEEGITNAITHRNYAISGEHTKIFIYDDRMEILSPGDLPGIVTINNIKEKRYARNPIISRTLTELGVVKELNEGVSRIYKEMSEFFLEVPIYIEEKGISLKLILKNNIVMRSKRKNELLLKDSKINLKWYKLNAMEQKVLQIIFDKGDVMPTEI